MSITMLIVYYKDLYINQQQKEEVQEDYIEIN